LGAIYKHFDWGGISLSIKLSGLSVNETPIGALKYLSFKLSGLSIKMGIYRPKL
jgi:hypothetical protein